jgi:hypothetical protein
MAETRNAYELLFGKPQKRQLGRPGFRWENIQMKESG